MNFDIYIIQNKYLKIIYSDFYKNFIKIRMSSFSKADKKIECCDSILSILDTGFSLVVGNEVLYKNDIPLEKNDIYSVINNAISLLFDSDKSLYTHSVVVSNGKNGCLILGNFGSGKTTIAFECQKNGFEINSADLSCLKIESKGLKMVQGSKYLVYNNNTGYLENDNTSKKIDIKLIIFCVGVCENGNFKVEQIPIIYFVKKFFDISSFHFKFPLLTNNEFLPSLYRNNLNFIKKVSEDINIEKFNVRGDSSLIADFIVNKIGGKI